MKSHSVSGIIAILLTLILVIPPVGITVTILVVLVGLTSMRKHDRVKANVHQQRG